MDIFEKEDFRSGESLFISYATSIHNLWLAAPIVFDFSFINHTDIYSDEY